MFIPHFALGRLQCTRISLINDSLHGDNYYKRPHNINMQRRSVIITFLTVKSVQPEHCFNKNQGRRVCFRSNFFHRFQSDWSLTQEVSGLSTWFDRGPVLDISFKKYWLYASGELQTNTLVDCLTASWNPLWQWNWRVSYQITEWKIGNMQILVFFPLNSFCHSMCPKKLSTTFCLG